MADPIYVCEYDREFTRNLYDNALNFVASDYFRAEIVDARKIPLREIGRRPVIFVGNHSGSGLSWDNIIFDVLLHRLLVEHFDGDTDRALRHKLRRLVASDLIDGGSVVPFGIKGWWQKTGCIPVSMENFRWAAENVALTYMSPEGVPGIAKGFHRRYQLQRYSSSFLYFAHKYKAIVVPVSIVNAEYIRPYNYCNESFNRLMNRLGYPFFPLGPAWLQLLCPATYLTPYPAKLTYVIHDPVAFDGDGEAPDRETLQAQAEGFRHKHQILLSQAVREFHAPYGFKSLWQAFRRSSRKRDFIPFFWHDFFLRAEGILPWWVRQLYKIPLLGFPLVYLARRYYDSRNPVSWTRQAGANTP